MKSLVLKLDFKDENYAKALGIAFSNFYKNFIITSGDSTKYDLLLTDDYNLFCKGCSVEGNPEIGCTDRGSEGKDSAWKKVYFTEEYNADNETSLYKNVLYKYSDIHNISEELIRIYEKNRGIKLYKNREKEFKKYVFAGCGGGVGTTAIALTLSRILSIYHGKKVLFLNLKTFSNEYFAMHEQILGQSFAEYEYHFLKYYQEHKNRTRNISQDEYGVYFFHEPYGINSCKLSDHENFEEIINEISERLKIDFVIVDMGADFSSNEMRKMDGTDGIVLVHKGNLNRKRRDAILKYAKLCDVNFEKHYDIVNFADEQIDKTLEQVSSDDYFYIYEDKESFAINQEEGHIGINNDRSFGIVVSEFTRFLML